MKKYCILLLLILCLTGCSNTTVELDPQIAAKTLSDASTGESLLSKLDQSAALALYSLSEADVAECCVYVGNSGTVDEISVWKAVSAAAADTIEEQVRERISTQKDVYADYRPDEIPKLNSAVVSRHGLYIILFVDADAQAAQKAVDALF